MGATISEKILAKKSNRKKVVPGEFVRAKVDGGLANDVTSPVLVKAYESMSVERPAILPEGFIIYFDHFVPAPTELAAAQHRKVREFCKKYAGYNIKLSDA